ncbi:cupin domain-containing protein [Pseudovibrio exalbescens]|uniref:Aldehyde dehydrogenase n=1 Tax=Pseudovibrio exalbescens TaxID=197461 RepID=A0A1U7JM30_9HYPH|nr:cupin domain-containing protein [Pseudovibrio exalbescens]OKL45779.1 aldehyde dehydrogenase [Pseudovibrio exalbescens]
MQDEEDDLGQRLRFVRIARGLSQRELAKRAGVTNATVSLIEAGKMNPSVGALKRLLAGIPMDLGEFFSLEAANEERLFYRADDLKQIGKDGVSYRLVGADRPQKSLQVLHEVYQPGAGSGRVPLIHQGEEAGVVVRGRVEVTVGSQRAILGAGDAYYFASNQPHSFKAVGTEEAEIVSACTPPTF